MSLVEETAVRLPLLALRGMVVFPKTVASFDVARKKSANALKAAMDGDRLLFVVTQKDYFVEEPQENDLYEIGCVVRVKQLLRVSDGIVKVLVEGLYRAKRITFKSGVQYLVADVLRCEDKASSNREIYNETVLRRIKLRFKSYLGVNPNITPDVIMTVESSKDIGFLSDFIAFNIPAPFDDKQFVLEQTSVAKRGKILLELLDKEREIGEIDRKINEKTRASIDESQKQFYLREQMKALSQELYGDDGSDEIDEYYARLEGLAAPDSVKEAISTHISKLAKMPQGSHEGTVERNYLDVCLELPWSNTTPVFSNIAKAEKILNRDIYGMEKVKERILELLAVFKLAGEVKGQIICLVGPPGVGKTSIGKTIAECMGRSFARISLGGVHDEAEIRGHRKTYIGAMPGKIITAVKQAGTCNPLILLDEVDKLGSDYKGDPSSALLEVLDPEQNGSFTDHFVEIPFDLSKTLFVATANTLDTIPAPLRDRMEIIELSSYTREEKFNIAKLHLAPKQLERNGIKKPQLRICDDAFYGIIDFYTREAGVRKLERTIAALCRKAAKLLADGEKAKVIIKENDLEAMLGKKKYKPERILPQNEVGIINGLAWTQVGGEIMQLEVAAMKGSGKIELTGSLGDVMKESAKAAVSFVRVNAQKYGIDPDFYKEQDIHIHATEAAVPKDGPSAGVTITTGLISALTNRPVRRDIAMTGEITLRGRVLPIGGLREKAMAAYAGGVRVVFIPKANIPDLEEVDAKIKENIEFVPVEFADEIIEKALIPLKAEEADNWEIGSEVVVQRNIRPTLR